MGAGPKCPLLFDRTHAVVEHDGTSALCDVLRCVHTYKNGWGCCFPVCGCGFMRKAELYSSSLHLAPVLVINSGGKEKITLFGLLN